MGDLNSKSRSILCPYFYPSQTSVIPLPPACHNFQWNIFGKRIKQHSPVICHHFAFSMRVAGIVILFLLYIVFLSDLEDSLFEIFTKLVVKPPKCLLLNFNNYTTGMICNCVLQIILCFLGLLPPSFSHDHLLP